MTGSTRPLAFLRFPISIPWPAATPPRGCRRLSRRHYWAVPRWIPTEPTGTARQELISEQFVRGQSDPELKKYLSVVIRTQKERKLQTLIAVCTDFASLGQTATVHRPAEQVFVMEEDDDPEDMVAMMDHSQWTGWCAIEPNMPPPLQQMFALARRMGYEMRPIGRHTGATHQTPSAPRLTAQGYRAPFRPGRDYSKVKCFGCGNMGHTQARSQTNLPFRPDGWNTQPDGPRRCPDGPQQGNDI